MKKMIFCILSIIPLITGCSGIYSNFRELEQIRVIQTMGIDCIPGGVRLSLASASAANSDDNALCLSGTGSSVSEALEHIRSSSGQDDLFLSHVKRIIIGEEAAKRGIGDSLSYICRSPDLRIDTPVFIAKARSAEEIMSGCSSDKKGISEIFQALESNENQHNSRIITASEIINSLSKNNGSPVCCVEYRKSSEESENSDESSMTAILSGYAVFKGDRLTAFIDSDNAEGADILLNRTGISDITVSDSKGRPVSLEINSGSCSTAPVLDEDDRLCGIDVNIDVNATVLELSDEEQLSAEALEDYLISKLESEISSRAAYVLQLSRKLQTDFLGLSGRLSRSSPVKLHDISDNFEELLPLLELRISVHGELCHTNDLKDS